MSPLRVTVNVPVSRPASAAALSVAVMVTVAGAGRAGHAEGIDEFSTTDASPVSLVSSAAEPMPRSAKASQIRQ